MGKMQFSKERGGETLTVTVQVKASSRVLEFRVLLMYVPTNIAENLYIFLLSESVDTGDLLHLPRLE